MTLYHAWAFLLVVLIQTGNSFGDFGDIGEEHDLDDLINKKFVHRQQQNVKRDSIATLPAILSSSSHGGHESGSGQDEDAAASVDETDIPQSAVAQDVAIDSDETSSRKDTVPTDLLHKEKPEHQHLLTITDLEKDEAVRFAKVFRDGTYGEVSNQKSVANIESKRNEIVPPPSSPTTEHHQPSIQEIFKRDHIQIHHNIAKLAKKFKKNNLLKDLSTITKDDGKTPNHVWEKFLRDAIEPKKRSRDVVGIKRQHFVANSNSGASANQQISSPSVAYMPQQQRQQIRPSYSSQTHIRPSYLSQQQQVATFAARQSAQQTNTYHPPNGLTGCLAENARCEKGHDEQCCGSESYCVNYWGAGKCVAFRATVPSDRNNPYKMMANLNAKNNFNSMLNKVKNELSSFAYHRKTGDVLKMAQL